MAVKTTSNASRSIKSKAKLLLAFSHKQLQKCKNAPELHMVIFGSQGKARKLFPTSAEWFAFQSTAEFAEIFALIGTLPGARSRDTNGHAANGQLVVPLQLPRSVHEALLAEAMAEGVSLDQLCLSKLVAQLRKLV